MFGTILLIIGVIVLYKLIFGFIIPVYRASRNIRQQFKNMNEQNMSGFRSDDTPEEPIKQEKKVQKDYIDFEEIK